MKKEIVALGILFVVMFIVIGFLVIGQLFEITGSDNERLINTNPIELHLYPETFDDYCKDVGSQCPSAYRISCKPYTGYSGDFGFGTDLCPITYFYGAERKLIGSFCAEQPILKIHSATAEMYFEDYFGDRTVPLYIGMTDNAELSNQNSTISYTSFNDYNAPRYRTVNYNVDVMTEYVKGNNCFDLYAVGGRYYKNYRVGCDVTIDYIDISYDPVECLEDIECDDGLITTEDTCVDFICQHETIVAKLPTKPEPSGLVSIMQSIGDWIINIFNNIAEAIPFSIVGTEELIPGTTETYNIYITVPIPDSDYTDGYFETQYAYWVLTDKDKNIIDSGAKYGAEVVEVFGIYNASVNVTVPNVVTDYILVATIEQINSNYSYATQTWTETDRMVITKEALNLKTKIPIPDKPEPTGLSGILTRLFDWLKSLFSIFGW